MPGTDCPRNWSRRTLLGIGCAVGTLFGGVLGVLIHAVIPPLGDGTWSNAPGGFLLSTVSTSSVTTTLFGSNPSHTLRVLQSVGVLLPLFTGLLRFTANDQSEVNERVNDYLLLGIVGLVIAGVVASLAATLAETTAVLELSLLFVLFTFTIIGVAAVVMFEGITEVPSSSESEADENESDDKTQRIVEANPSESEKIESDETAHDGPRTESDSENDDDERSTESTETQLADPEDDEA